MSTRFVIGQTVRVRRAEPPGHVRTPHYVRGHVGVVDGIAGVYANPEELAYGRDGLPVRPLYRVRFDQAELWSDDLGSARDTTAVDIFEHWLEAAGEAA